MQSESRLPDQRKLTNASSISACAVDSNVEDGNQHKIMKNIYADFPAPTHWQDFERLTLDICRAEWRDDYAESNGRGGQAQGGVDVFGYNYRLREHTGVQCKKRKTKSQGILPPANTLSIADIDDEIKAAKNFTPPLDRFIIATTGPRDVDLQAHVRNINAARSYPFQIALWFWDDYVKFLNDDNDGNLAYRYYANSLKFRERYSQEEHFLRLLAMAFDRPAMRTPFHLENRVSDFIDALSRLQQAVRTGILKDRSGRTVDEARPPAKVSTELKAIRLGLDKLRDLTTQALADGRIKQHEAVIEIFDPTLQGTFNNLRETIIANLNRMLTPAGIEAIELR